uniref:Uncharacterized protein n=1 Tax=Arundo donax TaxID=35708 RepID=A0A0A8YIS9_ARUDO
MLESEGAECRTAGTVSWRPRALAGMLLSLVISKLLPSD